MKKLPYLDQPLVPLAVALRSCSRRPRRKLPRQYQPKEHISKKGQTYCVNGLRRNQQSHSRPLPLAVVLPRMLAEIEASLATAGPGETQRLRQRGRVDPRAASPDGDPLHPVI
jgi:hypothetical protein